MSFGKKFGIQAAMEELDQEAETAVTDEVVEMPADEETLDAAVAETAEASAEVDNGGDSIEEAIGDAETLADVADKMEETEETGGMDDKAAAIAEVAIEALYERLHVTRRKAMPAMESFGSQSSRQKATRIAIESIRDDLKKVWAAIAAMAAKVYEFIKNFLKSVFDTSTKLKAQAEKLQKAVQSVKGTPEAAEFENEKLGKQLSLGGKVSVEGTAKGVADLVKEGQKHVEVFLGLGEELSGSDYASFIKDQKAFDSVKSAMDKPDGFTVDDDGKYGKAPEGTAVLVSGELLGNRVMKLVLPVTQESGAPSWNAAGNASFSVETFDEKQKPVTSVPTLSAEDMKKALAQVLELAEGIDKLKPALTKAEEATGKLVTATRKAAVMNIAEDKDAFARGRAVSKAVGKFANVLTRPGTAQIKLMAEVAKAELDWVVKSAAQYKGAQMAALPAPDKKEDGEAAA